MVTKYYAEYDLTSNQSLCIKCNKNEANNRDQICRKCKTAPCIDCKKEFTPIKQSTRCSSCKAKLKRLEQKPGYSDG